MGRSRRRITRRTAPPRPTYDGAPAARAGADVPQRPAAPRTTGMSIERQSALMVVEVKRVLIVSGTCFAMLFALAIVQRVT